MKSIIKSLYMLLFSTAISLPAHVWAQQKTGFHVLTVFPIHSAGGWDYITVDGAAKRVYASHGMQVNILNAATGDSVGYIPDTKGVHGVAIATEFNKGYTSNGRGNNITVFDLKTNQVLKQVDAGTNPDAIFYDDFSKKIYAFNGSVISVVLAASLFFYFKYRREALFVLLTSLAGLLSTLVKILVNRPRPTEPLVRIVQKVNEQSFPSGHVLFYILFFGFLTVLMYDLKSIPKAVRITVSTVSMVLIFVIPISRIYLGAHWFTDVLGGSLLGLLSLYVLCYFYFKRFAR